MNEHLNEKSFLSFLNALIRYLASGYIFIMVFQYLRADDTIWHFTKENINLTIVFIAAICGILIYALHAAFLDDFFYRISLWFLIKKKKNKALYLPQEFTDFIGDNGEPNKKNISWIMFQLTTYRYTRDSLKDEFTMAMQSRLNQLLALLVFLYTSSYSLIILPVIFWIKNLRVATWQQLFFNNNYFLILGLGIFLLISAFILDIKITKRELFLVLYHEKKASFFTE